MTSREKIETVNTDGNASNTSQGVLPHASYKPLMEALLGGKISRETWCSEILPEEHEWKSIHQQLWTLAMEDDASAADQPMPSKLLVQKIRRADWDERNEWMKELKLSPQQETWNTQFLECFVDGQSEKFKEYVWQQFSAGRASELLNNTMDILLYNSQMETDSICAALMARLKGLQGFFVLGIVSMKKEVSDKIFWSQRLRIEREMLTSEEVADMERWRKTALDNAPESVRLYYESLREPIRHNILFDAVLSVADTEEKAKLLSKRGNGSSEEEMWELDFFMAATADEKFVERVASMVVVGAMKLQAQGDSLGFCEPLEESHNEDKELLLEGTEPNSQYGPRLHTKAARDFIRGHHVPPTCRHAASERTFCVCKFEQRIERGHYKKDTSSSGQER